jgi:hypothetical protein
MEQETIRNQKQLIKNAKIVMVKTSLGSAVKITKKVAYGYVDFCIDNGYEQQIEIINLITNSDTLLKGKYLVYLV